MRMMGEGFGEAATPFWKTTGRLLCTAFFDLIPARRKEKPTIALLLFYLLGHPFGRKTELLSSLSSPSVSQPLHSISFIVSIVFYLRMCSLKLCLLAYRVGE